MSRNLVYGLLHIPSASYITLHNKTALFQDTVAANIMLSIATNTKRYYWGCSRDDFEIDKINLIAYGNIDALEFDIVGIPKDSLSNEALCHILKAQEYTFSLSI